MNRPRPPKRNRHQQRKKPARKPAPAAAVAAAEAAMASGDWDAAVRAYRRIVKARPDIAGVWSDLGGLYLMTGQADAARDALIRAVELAPQSVDALSNLAALERQTGDNAAALDLYRRVLDIAPDRANAWHEIARIKRFNTDDPDIDAMQRLADALDGGLDGAQGGGGGGDEAGGQGGDEAGAAAMHTAFALAKAYEDTGAYDLAFAHLETANRLKRASLDFDLGPTVRAVDTLIRTFDPGFFMNRAGAGHQGRDTAQPILIVGMPRSGTSLVEQILSAHSQVTGAGELTDLETAVAAHLPGFPEGLATAGRDVFRHIGADYAARLHRHAGHYAGRHAGHHAAAATPPHAPPDNHHITDKMPGNFIFVGLLAVALPGAKIIHCVRSPMDTCVSCYALHFPYGQPFSYDLRELGGYYRQYRRLMDHWNRVLPDKVLDISYEDLVRDPDTESRRLIAHCGLSWEDACLEFHNQDRMVATASAGQVRQPIYQGSVARWRRFENHLGPLQETLGDDAD